MIIKSATYLKSSAKLEQCPPPTLPEYAFIGRSNVGKSSLINMLVEHKGLAKTSGNPGKTQLINHFLVNENWYLVDLPGYGYAKSSKKDRSKWDAMSKNYFLRRDSLVCVFLLIDCRVSPQTSDIEFANWLGKHQIPFVFVFTKADKLNKYKLHINIGRFEDAMLQNWQELPQAFITSAEKKSGRLEILGYINMLNETEPDQ